MHKQIYFLAVLTILTFGVFLLNLTMGSVKIPFDELLAMLSRGNSVIDDVNCSIVSDIRLPRALASIMGGACIAVSGLLLQIFFKNPIVEPYVLGISSGSTLFMAFAILGGSSFGLTSLTPLFLFIGSFAGAMVVMIFIVLAAKKAKSITTLLIIGIMAGFICSAAKAVLMAFADKEQIGSLTMWTLGSFSGFSWNSLFYLYSIATPFILLSLLISKPLNLFLFGENYAGSMGLNVKLFRILIVCVSGILTAVITAFAGPISFVGLAVPHLIRILLKTSNNRLLIPGVIIAGAFMTSLCDLGARMIVSPSELPLGAVTSLLGAPLVIYLLLRRESHL